ncbi:accessory gene regulator B family protein [Emergencia sp.]|uniref:accessory gene regulator B family protein n=1 Tax=Emergencia sp. TaxID=1926557 RepID=UPI003AEFF1E2
MTSISERLLGSLIKENIISAEDREIYLFGIKELLSQIFTYFIMFGIGAALGMLIETIVFTAVYMSLRVYAGGYHASTQLRCYILSFGMLIAALLVIRWINVSEIVAGGAIILIGGIIYFMAPSEHKNKPLSQNEKKIYKKKVGKRVIVCIMIAFAAAVIDVGKILDTIGVAMMLLVIMMICNRQEKC